MNDELITKLSKNALIGERLTKLTLVERQKVVVKLLSKMSERELSDEIGIPHSTLHDWKSGRQCNVGEHLHVSLTVIVRKLESFKPVCSDDFVKLHRIKNIVDKLLEN